MQIGLGMAEYDRLATFVSNLTLQPIGVNECQHVSLDPTSNFQSILFKLLPGKQ